LFFYYFEFYRGFHRDRARCTVSQISAWFGLGSRLGDVATVKRSITRLNGRLNGMDNAQPQFDWKDQAAQVLSQPPKPAAKGG